MIDQRPQDGGGGGAAERADKRPVIVAGAALPAAVAGSHSCGVVEKVRGLGQHESPRNGIGLPPVIASQRGARSRDPLARNDAERSTQYHGYPAQFNDPGGNGFPLDE